MPKLELTAENLAELEELLERGRELRAELDRIESSIEAMVEEDIDKLDEWLGNGLDVGTLLNHVNSEDCNGDDCEETVSPDEPYYATPCGTYCGECMVTHMEECGVCRQQFGESADTKSKEEHPN